MRLSDAAHEILETYWMEVVEKDGSDLPLSDLGQSHNEDALRELVGAGLATTSGEVLRLTPDGVREARRTIRRHRLAERLLADVLETHANLLEDAACRFEHVLHEGIDESVCTLLGHPTACPHGLPIPPGDCCKRAEVVGRKVISRLADLGPGDSGEIAYVHTTDPEKLQKLMAMGILPGMPIELVRQYPSYVFNVGNTQYAVDRAMADEIYVRLTGNKL
ncbi:MAG: metal-dependent transcriptional regulator [Armatimonadota bacterium]